MKNCDNKQPDIKIKLLCALLEETKEKHCFTNDLISQLYKNPSLNTVKVAFGQYKCQYTRHSNDSHYKNETAA